ncbi:hypothetical protein CHARACLAT_029616 [Characodon lateralis]|uniref:Uncharacterized protein n=1 Tax=Characodon lateralis TaxID=208331 RepID=A0ABU7CUM6_9TELE|nr:hypothetical protein [Characodon lateralis]
MQRERRSCSAALSLNNPSAFVRSIKIDVRAAESDCVEMNHAAGPRAAEEPSRAVCPSSSCTSAGLLPSQRDITQRPGSCCFLRGLRYYRLIGSLLSERESPHWI